MRRLGVAIGAALILLTGCSGSHAQERTLNVTISAGYQAATELCVQSAKQAIDRGEEDPKVLAAYNDCMAKADKVAGRKP